MDPLAVLGPLTKQRLGQVTDTSPCAFCAMLATRGPAYISPRNAGEGRRFHAHCGCTVEEVFGSWEPDEREQRMIDLYQQSAGGSTKDVLASMRANDQGVIIDAHIPEGEKAKPGRKPGEVEVAVEVAVLASAADAARDA